MNTEEDILLKLLRGKPISIGICKIHPLHLNEIDDMDNGELTYRQYISPLLLDKNNIIEQDPSLAERSAFEIFLLYCFHDKEYRKIVLDSLKLFSKDEPFYHPEGFIFFGKIEEQRFLDDVVFDRLQSVIKQQNFLKEDKPENEPIYANEKSREFAELVKKAKAEAQAQIQAMNKDKILRLGDIISIVSAYSENINLFNIWDLTVYQLYDSYLRLLMRDSYDARFSMMLAGAEIKDELKHWNSRLILESE